MLTIQMFDCTSFVFLLLARHSPSAAFGSQGKRFFTSFRMTKGLGFGRSLRGTPGDSRMFAGLRRPRLRPARLKRAARCTGNCSKNHCSAPSAAFLIAIAPCACCGPPRPCDGRLVVRRRRMVVDLLFAAFGRWQFGVFPFPHAARLFVAPRQPFDGSLRALRPSIYAEVAGAAGPSDRILHGNLR